MNHLLNEIQINIKLKDNSGILEDQSVIYIV
jgi:hypothetical protein